MQPRIANWTIAFIVALFLHSLLLIVVKVPQSGAKELGVGGIHASLVKIKRNIQGAAQESTNQLKRIEQKLEKKERKQQKVVKKKVPPKPKDKSLITISEKRKKEIEKAVKFETPIGKPIVAPSLSSTKNKLAKLNQAPTQTAGANAPSGVSKNTTLGGASKKAKSDYLNQLKTLLERQKKYPNKARKRRQEGTVQLWFKVDRSGKLLAHKINKSSGYRLLDKEVEQLIQRAAPLPAFPSDIQTASLEITVPISFRFK